MGLFPGGPSKNYLCWCLISVYSQKPCQTSSEQNLTLNLYTLILVIRVYKFNVRFNVRGLRILCKSG